MTTIFSVIISGYYSTHTAMVNLCLSTLSNKEGDYATHTNMQHPKTWLLSCVCHRTSPYNSISVFLIHSKSHLIKTSYCLCTMELKRGRHHHNFNIIYARHGFQNFLYMQLYNSSNSLQQSLARNFIWFF